MKVYCVRWKALVGAAVVSVMCGGMAMAQQATQPEVRQQPTQPGVAQQVPLGQAGQNHAGKSWGDRQIVKCLIMDNKHEIEFARMADRQADSDEVKEFAQMMIEDHSKFIKKLEEFKGDKDDQASRQANQPATQSTTAQAHQGQKTDFVAIHREIGEKLFTAVKAELESKEGEQFDQCYMTQQVMCHTKMVASLEVLQNHVSGELRNILSEGLDTTKQHLNKAEEIVKNLDDDDDKND